MFSFDISLPIVIGADLLKLSQRKDTVSSLNVKLRLICSTQQLKQIMTTTKKQAITVKQLEYFEDIQIIRCDKYMEACDNAISIPISNQQLSSIQTQLYSMFPFKLAYLVQKDNLQLVFEKTNINLSFISINKPKFVKNQRLETEITQKQQNWGLLSMDKSHRIILQSKKTNFPIIGLWINTSQTVNGYHTMRNIGSFLWQKYSNKCKFVFQRRTFIYLVKVNRQKKTAQLFLVEYKTDDPTIESIPIDKADLNSKQQLILQSEQKSNLQFTLRSDEKVPQKLMNIPCSPIKFTSGSPFLDDSDKLQRMDSPRFRIQPDKIMERECESLKTLVKLQQIQINELKAELLRVNSQLRIAKRHKNYYQTDHSMSSISPSKQQAYSNKPSKRLTQSDLNIDNMQTTNSHIQPESSGSVKSGKKHFQGECLQQDNIWDRFEIVDK